MSDSDDSDVSEIPFYPEMLKTNNREQCLMSVGNNRVMKLSFVTRPLTAPTFSRLSSTSPRATIQDFPPIMHTHDRADRLKKLGTVALKVALSKHLDATYPEASPALLKELYDANLSRQHLARVAQLLESKGLILIMRVNENEKLGVDDDGLRLSMDNYGYGVASDTVERGIHDLHDTWELHMMEIQGNDGEIKRVSSKELGKGFRLGMYNYVMMIAGLVYTEKKHNLQDFWETFKVLMEVIVGPEDLVDWREDARAFEAEMRFVIEAVPRYACFYVKPC